MEEESAIHSSNSEEAENILAATVLSDTLENEESPTEISGMEDLVDDERPNSLKLQLVQRKSTELSNIVSEWGKKVF